MKTLLKLLVPCLVVLAVSVAPALSQQAPTDFGSGLVQQRAEAPAPPLRLAAQGGAVLARLLPAEVAAADEIEAVRAWNRAGRRPFKVGFDRALPATTRVSLGPAALGRASGGWVPHEGGLLARSGAAAVWGAEVQVAGAYLVRLHLSEVDLPAGARIWAYGEDGVAMGSVGLEARDEHGGIWLPPVIGGTVRLEVRAPAGSLTNRTGFRVDRVSEILPLSGLRRDQSVTTRGAGDCILDAQCDDQIPLTTERTDAIQSASARIVYQSGTSSFICSGGLINDLVASSRLPNFLTANHCISQPSEALSVIAYWDDFTEMCGGPPLPLAQLPVSNVAQLLETSPDSDVTLLRFYDVPGFENRALLGWNADEDILTDGLTLHRISLPAPNGPGLPQHYSRGTLDAQIGICDPIVPRPNFIYSQTNLGGTFGGSSGGPLLVEGPNPQDLWVVGQLFGACGYNGADPNDGCDYDGTREIDGAFSESFGLLEGCLSGSACCGPVGATMCLNQDRFQVTMDWRSNGADPLLPANVVQGTPSDDSGLFYFRNPNNWEMLVKIVDACSFNDRYWVFFAATTNVGFDVTVTDTQTGESKVYSNALGNPAAPIQDTQAFATCP